MIPTTKLGIALVALAFWAPIQPAGAQGEWNRRISDVHIVHPPATPPGTWRVVAEVEVWATDGTPQPVSLDCDLALSLNGTPIDTQSHGAMLAAPQCTFVLPCGGQCGPWANIPPYPPYPGICSAVTLGSGAQACACRGRIIVDFGPYSGLHAADQLAVTATARPGSLPEVDTSDDTFTLAVSDNVVGTVFCTGDGALPTACPCGNTGAAGHGCGNSASPGGALLRATGFSGVDPNTGQDSVVLHGSGMPDTSTCMYLRSTGSNQNGLVFGDGLRCVNGTVIRMRIKTNVGGTSLFPEPGDPSLSQAGNTPPGSGSIGWYQIYYRNAGAFCAPGTFNLSNGVWIEW